MSVIDPEKRVQLQPKRMEYCLQQIAGLGFEITELTKTYFCFVFKGEVVKMFPFTGWHSGKSIKDGRGIDNLLKQIKS